MYQKTLLKQMVCSSCGVRMGLDYPWKKRCMSCWRTWKNQQPQKSKNEVEHMSPEVHQMILKRIAERKQREEEQ
jgi:hypothetical protein